MKASTKRNVVRWLHIGVGGVIATYIYSPWGDIQTFEIMVKAVVIPFTVLSGLWLWKGNLISKFFEARKLN